MRALDVALVVSLLAAAGSVVYRVTRPAPVSPPSAKPELVVRRILDPEWGRVEPETSVGPAGRVRFVPEEGERIAGIGTATFFREEPVRGITGDGVEVHERQSGDTLYLGSWASKTQAGGPAALRYVLWVDRDGVRESRGGWARVLMPDLATGSVRVHAPRRTDAIVRVRLSDGQAVPGALVSLDVAPLTAGSHSQIALTGDDGVARFSGLEPGRTWVARIPGGIGPYTLDLATTFASGESPRPLVVPLAGQWTFLSYPIHPTFPGQTLVLESIEQPGLTQPVIFAVTHVMPPGVGDRARLVVAHKAGASLPPDVAVTFSGYETARFPVTGPTEEVRLASVAPKPPHKAADGRVPKGAMALPASSDGK